MADVSQLLSLYETTESLTEAKAALDQIAATQYPEDLELGEYYDDLATVAAEYEEFGLAAEAQRLAIELGCRLPDLAEDMLGWYLLLDGKSAEGEGVFAASVARRGDDPELHGTIGAARRDAGDIEGALRAYDRALELAEGVTASVSPKGYRERSAVRRFRAERQECRDELGLPADESDRIAGIATPGFPDAAAYAVAWFPQGEIDQALDRWPSLAGDLEDPDAHARSSRPVCAKCVRRPGVCLPSRPSVSSR